MWIHGVGTGHDHGRRWAWVSVRFAAIALAIVCIGGCSTGRTGPPDDDSRQPVDPPVVRSDDPTRFAGMSLDDAEVTGWLDDNGCVPNGWNWVCPQVFVEFGIDPDLTVTAVTLLAPAPRTAGYRGALPEGISFSDGPDIPPLVAPPTPTHDFATAAKRTNAWVQSVRSGRYVPPAS